MEASETSFEQALTEATDAANVALKSAAEVAKSARKARKAALEGDVSALGRCPKDLTKTLDDLRRSVADLERSVNSAATWPAAVGEEQDSFSDRYTTELREAAAAEGVGIHERDGALISFPTVLRVESDRSLRIDQKRIRTLRPSRVVSLLRDGQARLGRHKPQRFLDALYFVYEDIIKDQRKSALALGSLPPMPLSRIYRHLTALPGASRDYTKTDFARDLYILDSTGPKRAKRGNGPRVSFPSSTGTREKGYFSFVGPDGFEAKFYGIHFEEDV